MKRVVMLLVSAASLTLCVLSVDQWLHGQGRGYYLMRDSNFGPDGSVWRTEWALGVDQVSLSMGRFPPGYLYPSPIGDGWRVVPYQPDYSPPPPTGPANWLGFSCATRHPRATSYTSVRVPMWAIAVVTAVGSVPFLLAARRAFHAAVRLPRTLRERRRRGRGLCPACGYDLTANASGTCPECGRAVPFATAAAPVP